MSFSYQPAMSPYYCEAQYNRYPPAPAQQHSPGPSSFQPTPAIRRPVPYAPNDPEESDMQPLDLSLRTSKEEPVLKKPRMDYCYHQAQSSYPRAVATTGSESFMLVNHRTSPYSHHAVSISPSEAPSSSPSMDAQFHPRRDTLSPGCYTAKAKNKAFHVPRSSPVAFTSSAPSYSGATCMGLPHHMNPFGEKLSQMPLHNYSVQPEPKKYGESHQERETKRVYRDMDGGHCVTVHSNAMSSRDTFFRHERLTPVRHLDEEKVRPDSELCRLLASKPLEQKRSPRGDTHAFKCSSPDSKNDQSLKCLLATTNERSPNQTPPSLGRRSPAKHVSPNPVPSIASAPLSVADAGRVAVNFSPQSSDTIPKIKSKKSLLLSRTAGVFHTLPQPDIPASQLLTTNPVPNLQAPSPVAQTLTTCPVEMSVADTLVPPITDTAPPADKMGSEVSTKISVLDYWISKILMERSEDAPKKSCGVDYTHHIVDGQPKIRISFVDLLQLQVEQSLKA